MGRKHRLKCQKRYYIAKEPHSLTVSIPLEHVHLKEELGADPSSLTVSIPMTQYVEAPVGSLASLLQRARTSGFTFPPGWVHIPSVSTELIVCITSPFEGLPLLLGGWRFSRGGTKRTSSDRRVCGTNSKPHHVNFVFVLLCFLSLHAIYATI